MINSPRGAGGQHMRGWLAHLVKRRAVFGAACIGVGMLAAACFPSAPPQVALTVSPTSHDFGTVTRGTPTSTTFTVTNTGGPQAVWYTFGTTGNNTGSGFTTNPAATSCVENQILPQGQSCTITVSVSLTATGSFTGWIGLQTPYPFPAASATFKVTLS